MGEFPNRFYPKKRGTHTAKRMALEISRGDISADRFITRSLYVLSLCCREMSAPKLKIRPRDCSVFFPPIILLRVLAVSRAHPAGRGFMCGIRSCFRLVSYAFGGALCVCAAVLEHYFEVCWNITLEHCVKILCYDIMLEPYVRTFCSSRLHTYILFRGLWSTDTWDDGSRFALSVDFPGSPMYVLGFKRGRGKGPLRGQSTKSGNRVPSKLPSPHSQLPVQTSGRDPNICPCTMMGPQ